MKIWLGLASVVLAERLLHGLGASAPENSAFLNSQQDVIWDTTNITIGEVTTLNEGLEDFLADMVKLPYFRTYRVDMRDDRCPFEDDMGVCGNRACSIEPLSENDIKFSTPQYLGRLRKNSVTSTNPESAVENCAPEDSHIYAPSQSAEDRNYCYPEDESDAEAVWVDLTDNIERYTGYDGDHAHMIWQKVYAENCFDYFGPDHNISTSGITPTAEAGPFGLRNPLEEMQAAPEALQIPLEGCVEQRLFYRLLSGMHASISTHLSFDYLNKTTGIWGPNMDQYLERVGWHPDRLNHLYFNWVLVARAVEKLSHYNRLLSFAPSCSELDFSVRHNLQRLGSYLESKSRRGINETKLFASPQGAALKSEFRQRVRNVNALMSCVGCERCRLWGKIQTAGYGTALKFLFELPESPDIDPEAAADVLSDFRRSELVALLQTFARLSHSVSATEWFRIEADDALVNKATWQYQWNVGAAEAKKGLYFIFRSYVEFPKNLFKLGIAFMQNCWTRFISGGNSVPLHIDL